MTTTTARKTRAQKKKALAEAHRQEAKAIMRRRRRYQRAAGASRATVRLTRRAWARRRPMLPLHAALATALAAAGLDRVPDADRTYLVLLLAAGLLVWVAGRRRMWSQFYRRFGWWALTLFAVWLRAELTVGFAGTPMPGLLVVLTVVLQTVWWRHHLIDPEVTPKPDDRSDTWARRVASPRGSLTGSYLQDITELPQVEGAWEATIQLPHGELTTAEAVAAQRRIASAFDKPAGSVVVEPLITDEMSESRARLIVLDRLNPANEIHEYGWGWVRCDDGRVPVAVYPDGEEGWVQLWRPKSGPVHDLYSGDTGAGKSAAMELGVTQSVMTGHVFPIVCDPQGGQSLPAWAGPDGRAGWIADVEEGKEREITRTLHAVERAMYARSRRLARLEWVDEDGKLRRGVGFHDPALVPDMPILEVTIDEAHDVLKNYQAAQLVERVAKMARKTGIRLRLATQYPSMDQLGGAAAIRQQLAAGNVLAFRNSVKFSGNMILPSWMPNPADIPKRLANGEQSMGMCVIDSPAGARATYGRSVWVRRSHYWADQAATRIPKLDKATLDAFGEDFAGWRDRREARDADLMLPLPATVERLREVPAPSPAPGPSAPAAELIVAFLADHDRGKTTGVIAEHTGLRLSTVSQTCKRLADRGELIQPKRGSWALPSMAAATG